MPNMMIGDSGEYAVILSQTEPTEICLTCYGVVLSRFKNNHTEWHRNISGVAIGNTKRIEKLEAK